MIYHTNSSQKKVEVAILISDKVGFRANNTGNKEVHFIMMRSFNQEGVTVLTFMYLITASKQAKKKTGRTPDGKRQTHNYMLIFQYSLSNIDRICRKKIAKI